MKHDFTGDLSLSDGHGRVAGMDKRMRVHAEFDVVIPEATESETLADIERIQTMYWEEQGRQPDTTIEVKEDLPISTVVRELLKSPNHLASMTAHTIFIAGQKATGDRVLIENYRIKPVHEESPE